MAFIVFGVSLKIWDSCKYSSHINEKVFINQCANLLFLEYCLEGSLPSPSKADDSEGFVLLNKKHGERLIYRIIDAKSNIFSLSSKKLKYIKMFFQINGTTNDPTLTKIEGENLIQIREFYFNKEGSEEGELK
ncbi:MAG: hypothetical protein M0Q48_05620 [Verrucomicrobia bacterium]|nr:hypothetical protein [Verrucomicrobiota bacterium]